MEENEIIAYENQLSQIQLAISASPEGPDKENLKALENDIKELIKLTKETLQGSSKNENSIDAEYDLFKAELAELDKPSISKTEDKELSVNEINTALDDLDKDLKSLEGMKCQAPYKYQWSDEVSYHNALVCHVDRSSKITQSEDVKVRVMFTNPTHKEMLPCPYYLDGECRFSDDKCRFSHGEVVLFNGLREYREPNFSNLTMGSKVFAKQDDNLWHRAVITSMDGVICRVKFESNSKEEEIQLQNILPLDDLDIDDDDDDSTDSSSDDEDEDYHEALKLNEDEMIRRVLSAPPSSALGEWEKYTTGFGSKIMAKMGYIHGSGLGSKGDGRVEPVPAVILPAGKSLDHCMMLRENAGGDQDLFKAERKMKKIQKKHEAMLNKQYEKEKERTDVFTFLNKKLGQSSSEPKPKTNVQKNLKKETTKGLNVTSLQLAEEVKKTEREIKSLNQSLARHSADSQTFAVLKEKLDDKQAKLDQLQASERKVMNEQQQRRDQKKLSIF